MVIKRLRVDKMGKIEEKKCVLQRFMRRLFVSARPVDGVG